MQIEHNNDVVEHLQHCYQRVTRNSTCTEHKQRKTATRKRINFGHWQVSLSDTSPPWTISVAKIIPGSRDPMSFGVSNTRK